MKFTPEQEKRIFLSLRNEIKEVDSLIIQRIIGWVARNTHLFNFPTIKCNCNGENKDPNNQRTETT